MNTVKNIINLIILDESGSMQSVKDFVIRGFNETIQTIRGAAKNEPALQQWINFFSFNTEGIREQIKLSPVAELHELSSETYRPNAGTPLYDAIGHACNQVRSQMAEMENCSVLVTILTDGEENSSREFDHAAVAALIGELKQNGWIFTYMGANHDVEKVAISINIMNHSGFQASASGINSKLAEDSIARMALYKKIIAGSTDNLNEKYFDEEDNK
jgi:hypothetical protein